MSSSLADYPGNAGPFVSQMRNIPAKRCVSLELGKGFRFGLLDADSAHNFTKAVRAAIVRWYGWLQFDIEGLTPYVTCTSDVRRRLVRVEFLGRSGVASQGALVCNPEMVLALCEAIDRAAGPITDTGAGLH